MLVHLKDLATDGSTAEVGGGVLDFERIVRTALLAGVKHLFVEQDSSADPLASIGTSFRFLERLPADVRPRSRLSCWMRHRGAHGLTGPRASGPLIMSADPGGPTLRRRATTAEFTPPLVARSQQRNCFTARTPHFRRHRTAAATSRRRRAGPGWRRRRPRLSSGRSSSRCWRGPPRPATLASVRSAPRRC